MASGAAAERPSSQPGGVHLTEHDLQCAICMSLLTDPFATTCGHTFCYGCITTHLHASSTCPSCTAYLTKELTHPNFELSKLAKKAASAGAQDVGPAFAAVRRVVEERKAELAPAEVDALLDALLEHKRESEQRRRDGDMQLLLHFLQHSREDKERRLQALRSELGCLQADIDRVEATCGPTSEEAEQHAAGVSLEQSDQQPRAAAERLAQVTAAVQRRLGAECTSTACETLAAHPGMDTYMATQHPNAAPAPHEQPRGDAAGGSGDSGGSGGGGPGPQLPRAKKRRIASQFEDLQQAYLRLRADRLRRGGDSEGGGSDEARAPEAPPPLGAALVDDGLRSFSSMLSVLTRCNALRTLAEVPRPSLRQSSSIISSVEYDRDGALFATAGVSKRISVFERSTVVGSAGAAVHCPAVELISRSKLSCLSWSRYLAPHLAASDYEGVVTLWDVHAGQLVQEYEAHSRRVWSVDYCEADPTLLASGSDDCAVKVWSSRSPASLAQIELKANVCAVRWRPGSSHELAVGSADHSVYLYDLRRAAEPVSVLTGHRKAVSYVRFCGPDQVATASTDSTLRLWRVDAAPGAPAERVFEGHANEKNFVGLAANEDGFLACGSEANEAVVYYKELSRPVARQAFPPGGAEGGPGGGDDRTFVSAVCWRPGFRELLVADSQGTVRVMELAAGD